MNYRMRLHSRITELESVRWNELLVASNNGYLHPCLRHEYLNALEQSGSVGEGTGWTPCHISLWNEEELVGASPMYIKDHSYGEYVFDWAWADAYQRHGLNYYPKLLTAIPFTPVFGPRLLACDDDTREQLAAAILQFAQQSAEDATLLGTTISSWHGLYLPQQDAAAMEAEGCLKRSGVQFHWKNHSLQTGQPYSDFDEYLNALTQKKRKNIKAERRKVQEAGVECRSITGDMIEPAHLDFFYRCYTTTYLQHRSTPYLKRSFFTWLLQTMPEQVLLSMAYQGDKAVAASFCLFNEHTLYGRYWGALEFVPCLHFELAYYTPMQWAIEHGTQTFEGGAQGEHKWARGFEPTPTQSAHWLANESFYEAVERFLEREGNGMSAYIDELQEHSPFK